MDFLIAKNSDPKNFLEHFSKLAVQVGQHNCQQPTAIFGATGSGKTSLACLLGGYTLHGTYSCDQDLWKFEA